MNNNLSKCIDEIIDKIPSSLVADEVIKENNLLNKINDGFYQYQDGVWVKIDDEYVKRLIHAKFSSLIRDRLGKNHDNK